MKRKITVYLIFGAMTIIATINLLQWMQVLMFSDAQAAESIRFTYPTHNIVFDDPDLTDAYCVFFCRDTGDLVNGTTGEVGPDITWTQAAIKANKHSQSDVWVATVPSLDRGRRYVLYVLDGYSSASNNQNPVKALLYDPEKRIAIDAGVEAIDVR